MMEAPYGASSAVALPAPTPVAVVMSPQFCAAHMVPLTVTKKAMSFSSGDFTVTDTSGAVVLRVEGICFSVGSRRVLRDAAGRPILTMQAKNTTKHVCDFKIKGSYFDRSCAFYRGNSNTMIAQMKRKFTASNVLLGKDTFSVTVFPDVDYVFIVALVVILDEIHKD